MFALLHIDMASK